MTTPARSSLGSERLRHSRRWRLVLLQSTGLVLEMSDSASGFGWLKLLCRRYEAVCMRMIARPRHNAPPPLGFECRHELVQDGFVDLL